MSARRRVMTKVSGEFANATAIASGFISMHLFKMLIEKGVLSVDEGLAVLKRARNGLEQAIGARNLDPTLFEAEKVISSLYANLHDCRACNGRGGTAKPEDCRPAAAAASG
jgi:hypothetical protein